MSIQSEIRGLVDSAIRILDNGEWSPLRGGEWTALNGAVVIIHGPTRYCRKPSYRVVHPDFGVFAGYLNGATGRNIGRAAQILTKEQMVAEQMANDTRLRKKDADEIRAALAETEGR